MSPTLNKYQVAAKWLYHEDYAISGLGAVEFERHLSPSRRDCVERMVDEILEAPFGTYSRSRRQSVRPPTGAERTET